jgi:serine/threonine-protein kinase HipA
MPLTRRRHADAVVRPFLEGLLPDNEAVLDRWARQFHVSAANPFALLSHMGEDCAGAVQFVRPERLDALLHRPSEVEWLSESDVAQRLRDLVEDQGTGRTVGDPGYFSLAGAQPKTALIYEDERWGVPSGRIPTTHILKPPAQPNLSGFELNEHFCLALAGALELPVARSEVRRFEDRIAIVVRRYDRARRPSGELVRVHQEDVCQALAVPPQV